MNKLKNLLLLNKHLVHTPTRIFYAQQHLARVNAKHVSVIQKPNSRYCSKTGFTLRNSASHDSCFDIFFIIFRGNLKSSDRHAMLLG